MRLQLLSSGSSTWSIGSWRQVYYTSTFSFSFLSYYWEAYPAHIVFLHFLVCLVRCLFCVAKLTRPFIYLPHTHTPLFISLCVNSCFAFRGFIERCFFSQLFLSLCYQRKTHEFLIRLCSEIFLISWDVSRTHLIKNCMQCDYQLLEIISVTIASRHLINHELN